MWNGTRDLEQLYSVYPGNCPYLNVSLWARRKQCTSPAEGMSGQQGRTKPGEKVRESMVWMSKPCLEDGMKINLGTAEVLSKLGAEPRSESMPPISIKVLFQLHFGSQAYWMVGYGVWKDGRIQDDSEIRGWDDGIAVIIMNIRRQSSLHFLGENV